MRELIIAFVFAGSRGRRKSTPGVRLMEHNGRFGGKHGSAIGSFWIRGTIDQPSVHEAEYHPVFAPDFRPKHWHQSRKHIFALEDKRGGPGLNSSTTTINPSNQVPEGYDIRQMDGS